MKYSLYFQAHVKKERCWLLSATLKYSEHVAMDRAIDKEKNIFELFVSPYLKDVFLDLMYKLEQEGVVSDLKQIHNRLQ